METERDAGAVRAGTQVPAGPGTPGSWSRATLATSSSVVDGAPARRRSSHAEIREVYREARRIARAALRRAPGASWNTTILVNEAFVRLLGSDWAERARHDPQLVLPVLRRVMENALADHHRRGNAEKRPEGRQRPRVFYHDGMMAFDEDPAVLLAILEAIDRLRAGTDRACELSDRSGFARVLELGFVLGCSTREIAERLDVPQTTVSRWLRFGRAVLNEALERQSSDG